jgi:hypothetical protein
MAWLGPAILDLRNGGLDPEKARLISLTYVANERLARLAQRPVSQWVSETGCN